MKALEENPKKVFKNDINREISISAQGGIAFIDVYFQNGNCYIDPSKDWHEVKQPVTWQEAIEAWANGKRIRCVINKAEFIFEKRHYREFQDQNDYGLAVEQITKGTWYIED